eukprot:758145-Hanusia_phi.AAC.1
MSPLPMEEEGKRTGREEGGRKQREESDKLEAHNCLTLGNQTEGYQTCNVGSQLDNKKKTLVLASLHFLGFLARLILLSEQELGICPEVS